MVGGSGTSIGFRTSTSLHFPASTFRRATSVPWKIRRCLLQSHTPPWSLQTMPLKCGKYWRGSCMSHPAGARDCEVVVSLFAARHETSVRESQQNSMVRHLPLAQTFEKTYDNDTDERDEDRMADAEDKGTLRTRRTVLYAFNPTSNSTAGFRLIQPSKAHAKPLSAQSHWNGSILLDGRRVDR